ncbi:MAG TPA: tetratricopeptide repeat protein [Luteibacter sp.]|uniref:tetratricopeptide repeat protein n=1 Tax=Luteibacter sp. TaxID=1886636 RepID=UPI002CBACAC7|nr:tetratricopeptide repeat protein [Luteibacter sp.]HVI53556.1 tetratricopeptide repeat protein [Luteibacter sp.]
MHKPILTLVLFALTSVAASAADSPKDVQAMIARGDYPAAEAALRQAVSDHPQSAKAHYVLAEVLAHEGNIGEAKTEATKAATLDPSTKFTDPAKFQHFQHELDAALAPPSARPAAAATPTRFTEPQPAARAEAGGQSHMTGWLIGGVILVLIIFFVMRRRQNTNNQFGNGYPPAPPMNGGPSYGGQPYGGYPGGNPGYAPPPSSGVGTAVAAGLGGLAAGALLDEALRSHRDGEEPRNTGASGFGNLGPDTSAQPDPSGQAYDDLRDDPIDMGNNDSSWDDSSSGGGDDDNQW